MGRPALATVSDLELVVGPIDEDSLAETQAEARLEQASEIVRAYAGLTWLNADETAVENVPGQIPGVVVAMVERATLNPGGITQESAGPFSRSFGSDAASRLYMTKAERSIVRTAVGRAEVYTLGTTRGDLETADVLVSDIVDGERGWYDL